MKITIKNVPEEVRDELAARASLKHQSMQQFLHEELERIAASPSKEMLLDQMREHVDTSGRGVSAEAILPALENDKGYDRR